MTFTKSVVEFLQDHLGVSDLQIFSKPEWGQQNPEYRALIRAELVDIFSNENLHTSISHCQDVGIVIASSWPVGVDVEQNIRIKEKIVARVSASEELAIAPRAEALWCAKEACFKALRTYKQPSVISAVSIGDWKNIDSQTDTFRLFNWAEFKSPSENRGVVISTSLHTYSFFIFTS